MFNCFQGVVIFLCIPPRLLLHFNHNTEFLISCSRHTLVFLLCLRVRSRGSLVKIATSSPNKRVCSKTAPSLVNFVIPPLIFQANKSNRNHCCLGNDLWPKTKKRSLRPMWIVKSRQLYKHYQFSHCKTQRLHIESKNASEVWQSEGLMVFHSSNSQGQLIAAGTKFNSSVGCWWYISPHVQTRSLPIIYFF